MTMAESSMGLNKYYLIDKVIINENSEFIFDIYGTNSKEVRVSHVYEKGLKLVKDQVKNLISFQYLYVKEDQKSTYEHYYNDFMAQKVIPKDMENFYKEVGDSINKMFDNPESLSNVKEVQGVVSDMVENILKDDFTMSSFVSILAHDYYTHTHSLNVGVYALCLGKHIGMLKTDLEELGTAALLHDLGKAKLLKL